VNNAGGFSFLELLIVIAIVGVIASFAIPQYASYIATGQATACLGDRQLVDKLIILHMSEHPQIPLRGLNQLVSEGYLEEIPDCPYGGQYLLIPSTANRGIPAVGCSLHYWPGSGWEEGNAAMFMASTDFNDGNAAGWTETGPDWEVVDGVYIGGTSRGSSGNNRTFLGDENWTDYTVEVDADLMRGSGNAYGYGVYFRARDYDNLNAYIFQYDPGYGSSGALLFRKIVNGSEQAPFGMADLPAGYVWKDQVKHITVTVSGSSFAAYLSDMNGGAAPVLEASDSSYSRGAIGLGTWGSAQAGFDNIKVSPK